MLGGHYWVNVESLIDRAEPLVGQLPSPVRLSCLAVIVD